MRVFLFLALAALLGACARVAYHPDQKLGVEAMQADLDFMQQQLYTFHPGAFRYVARDSLDRLFAQTRRALGRPMTDREFRVRLFQLLDRIGCGHTEVIGSKALYRYRAKHRAHTLPLAAVYLDQKLWLTAHAATDSTLGLGQEIVMVDSIPAQEIVRGIYSINTSDGYNTTHKRVAVGRYFAMDFSYLYGERRRGRIWLRDSTGQVRQHVVVPRKPSPPPAKKAPAAKVPAVANRSQRPKYLINQATRRLWLSERDSTVAILDIDAFVGGKFEKFYRQTFKTLAEKKVQHLIIDLRYNGGGKITQNNFLLTYLLGQDFAFSYSKVDQTPTYRPHIEGRLVDWAGNRFFAMFPRRRVRWSDGVGFQRTEQAGLTHYNFHYRPAKRHHFGGKIFVLVNGGTFSAAAQTAAYLKHLHPTAVIVGEETGGGEAGCNANMLPWLVFPQTKVRMRLPLYRVNHELGLPDQGRGVLPDVASMPTVHDVLAQRDVALERVYQLIWSADTAQK
jgi:Peptidase family S41